MATEGKGGEVLGDESDAMAASAPAGVCVCASGRAGGRRARAFDPLRVLQSNPECVTTLCGCQARCVSRPSLL